MALHLTFSTLSAATDANIQIFENYARTRTHALRTATDELVAVGDIDAGDLLALVYVVPGTKQGQTVTDGGGQTEKWSDIREREDQAGTYFFLKPDDLHMTDVVYTTAEESAPGWYPDDVI